MGDYKGQLAEQDFPTQVADIRTHLMTAPQESRQALENLDPGATERLEALLDHVLVLTATITPEIIPTDRPGQLKAVLNEVTAAIDYMAEPTQMAVYGNQIVAATNNLATQLWTWQGSASGDDWKDTVTGAASTYRRSLGQQLVSFNSEMEELGAHVLASKRQLERLKETGEEFVTETNDELASLKARNAERLAALEAQIESLNTQVTAAVSRQDAAIQQYQEQFSTAQEKRNTDFAELMETTRQGLTASRNDYEKGGMKALADLQVQIDKAEEMVSVFAGAGTANAFGKEAGDQAKDANKWRWYAVALAIIGAAAAAVLILAFGSNKASVAEVVGKLAVAVVLAGAAGYAATQSTAHRRREVRNRRAELLLVSFEPFVRELPEDEKDKARVALLQTIMTDSNQAAAVAEKNEPVISASQLNLVKQVYDMIVKR
jgi:flagellar basal body-associated protein FliL